MHAIGHHFVLELMIQFFPLKKIIVNLDYQAFGQLFIFAAGSSPGLIQDISVILVNDLVVEPDETFELVATIPSTPANQAGFTQGGDQALGIIQSDVGMLLIILLSVMFNLHTYNTSSFECGI